MISKAKALAALGRSHGSESPGAFGRDFSLNSAATRAPSQRATRLLAVSFAAGLLIVLAGGSGAPPASADSCPNAQFRTGYSAYLPDCRAYEVVSPPAIPPYFETIATIPPPENITGASRAVGTPWAVQASVTGDRIGFFSTYAPPGSPSDGLNYLATRSSAGWTTQDVIPPQSTTNTGNVFCGDGYIAAYSPDLSKGILGDGVDQGSPANCGTDDPPLVAGEPQGFQNLFLRDNGSGSYQLIDLTPAGVAPSDAVFQAASADLSRVVFDENAQLTPDAPVPPSTCSTCAPGTDLYIWSGGVVRLVTVLPDGTPAQGSLANADDFFGTTGPGAEVFTHAVSADGSRAFFLANGNLYLRERPDQPQSPLGGSGDCTDPTKACTVQVDASQAGGSGGGGTFQWASVDGSQVFFTDDASAGLTADTVPGSGPNLYGYDVNSGTLTDLTAADDARVQGVSGTSDDGSHVYFVADGVLAAGASAGQPNLYLARGGATTFIATLDASNDSVDWNPNYLTARVSPSGTFIAFDSLSSLTGYDNTDANIGQPDQEIFLYDATANELRCASCDPTGAPPTAPARIRQPVWDPLVFERPPGYLQRNLSDDGRVFFDTANTLLPRDTNGQPDVYEYQGGQLQLISSGTGSTAAYFYDASPSGGDVFLFTSQQLVPQDTDNDISVYDARVGGGFPFTPVPPACSGDACKPPPSGSPQDQTPGSSGFSGPGNPAPTRQGPIRAKRCKKHHRKKKCRKARRAGAARGAAQ